MPCSAADLSSMTPLETQLRDGFVQVHTECPVLYAVITGVVYYI